MNILGKEINKKWFENYWFYYRIHTIVGIFVLLIIIFSAVECAHNVKTDTTVTYIGSSYMSEDFSDNFANELSPYIDDLDGDGVKKIYLSLLTLSGEVKSEQDIAMQQKAQLEIAVGDTYLFLMDEKYYTTYKEQELFMDVSEYLGINEPTYGVLLNNSAIMKKLGLKSNSNIYAAVRVITKGDETKKEKISSQNNAIKIINELYTPSAQ